jgi:hypothetical protein
MTQKENFQFHHGLFMQPARSASALDEQLARFGFFLTFFSQIASISDDDESTDCMYGLRHVGVAILTKCLVFCFLLVKESGRWATKGGMHEQMSSKVDICRPLNSAFRVPIYRPPAAAYFIPKLLLRP